MFAVSQLELRKAQDERDQLSLQVRSLEARVNLLNQQNIAMSNLNRNNAPRTRGYGRGGIYANDEEDYSAYSYRGRGARNEPTYDHIISRGTPPHGRGGNRRGRGGVQYTSIAEPAEEVKEPINI